MRVCGLVRYKKLSGFITLNIIALLLLNLTSCGGGDSAVVSGGQALRVEIDFPDEEGVLEPEVQSARTVEELTTCTIIVEGGDPPISEIIRMFDIDEPKSVSVPIGMDRMFTFIGMDEEGNPICRGEVTVDINPDTNSVTIGCEFVFEICVDGVDNDFDGDVDCADTECDRVGCSADDIDLQCIGGSCMLPEPEMPEMPEMPEDDDSNPACPDPAFPSPFPNPFPGQCFPPQPPSCDLFCPEEGECFCIDQEG